MAKNSLKRSAGHVGLGIMFSRILGLVRLQLFAFFLGATRYSDVFLMAFRIPNLLRDLFAEGALTTAFIPVFSDVLVNDSKKQAYYFANLVINLILFIVGSIVLLGIFFAPLLVRLIAPGYLDDPTKFELTIHLVKILMPFLLFVSLAAVVMGILNVQNVFFIPSFASATFNIVSIGAGLYIYFSHPDIKKAVIIWTIGALLGGVAQLITQLPILFKKGYRYQPVFRFFKNKNIKRLLFLIAPAVIGLAATQINILVNTILASTLKDGSLSWLTYAFRLIQLPIGLFGVAIATVNTAYASRAVAEKDMEKLKLNLASSLKLNYFLTIPATFGLFLLGSWIIRVLFQHGNFMAFDTLQTYWAVVLYGIGLFAYASVKVLAPVYYALSQSKIPMFSSIIAVIGNLVVSLSTYKWLGFKGLALGTSTAALFNFSFLIIVFYKKFGTLKKYRVSLSFIKILVASLIMASSLYFFVQKINFEVSFFNQILILSLFLLISVGIYLLATFLLKVEETKKFYNLIKKKFVK